MYMLSAFRRTATMYVVSAFRRTVTAVVVIRCPVSQGFEKEGGA